ncbi:unnamed protein product [Parnassius apollo]|uniref:(apollo) hypothetical protein n=1 Tax=Parnassius apollo TaxID=110799 RepID=A0A8S3YDA2_PARAO|nr:unnamed protein product [Parnassius apollo]
MRKCVFCKCRYEKGSKTSFHRFPSDLTARSVWLQNMKAVDWTPKEKDHLCSKHFDANCFNKHYNRTTLKLGSVPTIFEGVFENSNSCDDLEIADSKNESRGEKIDVVEPQPVVFTCAYKYAMSTSSTTESMSTSSSSSRWQSSKRRGVNRLLSECILEDNVLKKDASTTYESKSNLHDIARNEHSYEASQSPKKSRIEYGVAHDHQYENTPRSSKIAIQRARRSLKIRNARIKVLTQHVKRLKTKVANLKTIINDLNKRNKVSEEH